MNRYQRMWEEHRVVPVRFYNWRMVEDERMVIFYLNFRHPCPCKGWKLDREFAFMHTYDRRMFELLHASINPVREIKWWLRSEAINHVEEFLTCGTIDGEPV